MSTPTEGPTEAQLRAVNEAQTPEAYAAAAQAAGLTADAEAAAQAGARPVEAPDFAAQLDQMRRDQAAQLDQMRASFEAQLAAVQAGLPVPSTSNEVAAARNLSAGVADLAARYPGSPRVEPMQAANQDLAAAVEDPGDGTKVEDPDPALAGKVIARFRRWAAANRTKESGLVEHAAQVLEDLADV